MKAIFQKINKHSRCRPDKICEGRSSGMSINDRRRRSLIYEILEADPNKFCRVGIGNSSVSFEPHTTETGTGMKNETRRNIKLKKGKLKNRGSKLCGMKRNTGFHTTASPMQQQTSNIIPKQIRLYSIILNKRNRLIISLWLPT